MYSIKITDEASIDFSEFALSSDALELVEAFLAEGKRELGHYADARTVAEVDVLLEGVRRLL